MLQYTPNPSERYIWISASWSYIDNSYQLISLRLIWCGGKTGPMSGQKNKQLGNQQKQSQGGLSVQETSSHRVDRVLSCLSSRPNWDSPTPSHVSELCVPPFGSGGEAHSLKSLHRNTATMAQGVAWKTRT